MVRRHSATAGTLALLWMLAAPASAQVAPCSAMETSRNLPPAESPPLMRCYEFVFHPGGLHSVDRDAYNYYVSGALQPSLRGENKWTPYTQSDALNAFSRLWKTGFLDDLWVEVIDEPYENGVLGKHVIFHVEERARLKEFEYTGSKAVPVSTIEQALTENRIIRMGGGFGGFGDPFVLFEIRRVIKDLYAKAGYPDAIVVIKKTILPGGNRMLRVTFDIEEGPKIRLDATPPVMR